MRLTAGRPDSLRRRAAVLLAVLVVIVCVVMIALRLVRLTADFR